MTVTRGKGGDRTAQARVGCAHFMRGGSSRQKRGEGGGRGARSEGRGYLGYRRGAFQEGKAGGSAQGGGTEDSWIKSRKEGRPTKTKERKEGERKNSPLFTYA